MPVLNVSFDRLLWLGLIKLGEKDETPENTVRRIVREAVKKQEDEKK